MESCMVAFLCCYLVGSLWVTTGETLAYAQWYLVFLYYRYLWAILILFYRTSMRYSCLLDVNYWYIGSHPHKNNFQAMRLYTITAIKARGLFVQDGERCLQVLVLYLEAGLIVGRELLGMFRWSVNRASLGHIKSRKLLQLSFRQWR